MMLQYLSYLLCGIMSIFFWRILAVSLPVVCFLSLATCHHVDVVPIQFGFVCHPSGNLGLVWKPISVDFIQSKPALPCEKFFCACNLFQSCMLFEILPCQPSCPPSHAQIQTSAEHRENRGLNDACCRKDNGLPKTSKNCVSTPNPHSNPGKCQLFC